MANKRKKQELLNINTEDLPNIQVEHITELDTNPLYSLEIDPEDKYHFKDDEKLFIQNYIEFRNFPMAAELSKMDLDRAKEVFADYKIKNEIRRINRALYQRQFASKLLSLDQIGGYLSSMLIDEYTPLASQLSSKDKLKVVELLLDINDIKRNAINNPTLIINKDINLQLKELSVDAIKELLKRSANEDKLKKVEVIDDIDKDKTLTLEDKAYLETLPIEDLTNIINEISKNKEDKK